MRDRDGDDGLRVMAPWIRNPWVVGDHINADAHPGNFVVLSGPALGVLDFGAVRRTAPPCADGLRDALRPVLVGPRDFAMDGTLLALGELKQAHPIDALHFVPPPDVLHLMRALLATTRVSPSGAAPR